MPSSTAACSMRACSSSPSRSRSTSLPRRCERCSTSKVRPGQTPLQPPLARLLPIGVPALALAVALALLLPFCSVIFPANDRQIHTRRRQFEAHIVNRVGNDVGNGQVAKPLVI